MYEIKINGLEEQMSEVALRRRKTDVEVTEYIGSVPLASVGGLM